MAIIIGIYLLALVFAATQQESLLFHPNTTYLDAWWYEEFTLSMWDSQLTWLTNSSPTCDWNDAKVVLYFHGNAGNIYTQARQYELFEKLGVCFFSIDYPGYGKSEGNISSVDALYAAGDLLVEYVRTQWISDDRLVVRGYSLWGGIASHVAQKYTISNLVLQSTYTRLSDIAAEIYRMFPVRSLISYDLESIDTLEEYMWRVVVIHGTSDMTIPYAHGLSLYESYGWEKAFVTFEGGHRLGELGDEDLEKFF